MARGWNKPINDHPMDGIYIAFSGEEILELEFDDIDSKGD
jgi:hypothetical protein